MKTKLLYAAAALWLSAFAAGLTLYPGSKLIYLVFSISFLAVLLSGFYKQVSYGYIYLSVFLWLGFWLKLTAHLILKYAYAEPIGLFDGTPASWDAVLKISSVAGISMIAARAVYSWGGGRNMTLISGDECKAPAWYMPVRKWIWGSLLISVIGIAVFNAVFGIHQIGLYPRTIFPWPINALVAWSLNIGVAMAMATLVRWDISARQSVFAPILMVIGEAFTSTVSILSRGTFVYHSIPVLFSVLKNKVSLVRFSKYKVVFSLIFFVVSFFTSMYAVSALRRYYYADNIPEKVDISGNFSALLEQLTGLIVDRWIGLEGVMAVYAYPEKSASALMAAITEKRTTFEKPIYEYVSGSKYQAMDNKKYQFGSIPGAVGFFYYSGRVWVVSLGVFLLGLFVLGVENVVFRATRNPFLCSLIGMTAANTVAQFGTAPRQMIPHFVMIFIAVIIIRAVEKIPVDSV